MSLSELKKQYKQIQTKHKLPSFDLLNEEFEIEKLQEKETDYLIREIRRAASEKITVFLKFLELFLNPQAAPIFVLISLKNLNSNEKQKIEKLYRELVKLEIVSVELDISYNEKKEVEFIKEVLRRWNDIKKELHNICALLSDANKLESTKKRTSYFG